LSKKVERKRKKKKEATAGTLQAIASNTPKPSVDASNAEGEVKERHKQRDY
jgi:hypothetical protein